MRLFGGGFGIFGHGNVTCLGEALYGVQKELPLYRGQNEQSMGFAAAGYTKQWLRQRFMFCTASAGPGTANLLTSAALAHANRLRQRQPRGGERDKRRRRGDCGSGWRCHRVAPLGGLAGLGQ